MICERRIDQHDTIVRQERPPDFVFDSCRGLRFFLYSTLLSCGSIHLSHLVIGLENSCLIFNQRETTRKQAGSAFQRVDADTLKDLQANDLFIFLAGVVEAVRVLSYIITSLIINWRHAI